MENPRIGILFFGHEWFWSTKQFGPEFLNTLEDEVAGIKRSLGSFADIVGGEIVLNEIQAAKTARAVAIENTDLIILCPIVWSSDKPMLAALKQLDERIPLIVWCYNPLEKLAEKMTFAELIKGTGVVGALQMTSAMKRLGRKFVTVIGNENEAMRDIREYCTVAKLVGDLKNARIGILPWRYGEMVGTWVDETKLLRRTGLLIEPISVMELHEVSQLLSEPEVDSFLHYLRTNFEIEVSEESLRTSSRVSMALAKIVEKHNLDGITMQDLDEEMHRILKTRPGLYVKSMLKKGFVVGMEGDIQATICTLILQKLTGKPALFGEIFTFDLVDNTVPMGHSGVLNMDLAKDLAKIKIIPDYEYKSSDQVEGAYTYFSGKEGKVTLLSIVNEGDNFKMIACKGESIPTNEKIEGYAHILVRIDAPLKRFFELALRSGANQHWAVVHDDVVSKLEKLADLLGFEKTLII